MLQQILRAPAFKAILIQLLAFPLMLLLVYGLARAGVFLSLPGVAAVQGVLAAVITWQPNIHSSLFINIHRFLVEHAGATGIEAVMKAYKLYLEQMPPEAGEEPLLSLTRAWTLVRFFSSKMLAMAPCGKCGGKFVVNCLDLNADYVCGLCHMPSRAGKTKKARDEAAAAAPSALAA